VSARRCEREAAVAVAIREDTWDDELRAHAAACPICAEVLFVARVLLDDARATAAERPLPDPRLIWLEARLRARRLALARAGRPITIVRIVAAACGVAVAVVLAAWLEPHIGHWPGWLRPPSPDLASSFAFVQGVLLVAASGGFLVLAAYALISAWREP
jgi:hypothetical protein